MAKIVLWLARLLSLLAVARSALTWLGFAGALLGVSWLRIIKLAIANRSVAWLCITHLATLGSASLDSAWLVFNLTTLGLL